MKLLIFLVVCLIANVAFVQGYCDMPSCDGDPHIACDHHGWSPACPADRRMINFGLAQRDRIVNLHNTLRSKIASGDEPGFNPAVRMASMVWDDELAYLASLNVMQCDMNHDECRNTVRHDFAGQNLAIGSQTGSFQNIEEFLDDSIGGDEGWYGEVKDAQQSDIDECCDAASGGVIGHFTQIVQANANAVGCAMAQYTEGEWRTSLLACNYARTNIEGLPVYESGPTASQCTTGRSSQFNGLCSLAESINPNP